MTAAAAWVLTIILAATPAEALSRVHFQRAQKYFAQHDYRRALDEFTTASENAPTELPDLYFDIAQCHRNLGHARQAVLAFQHYLALRPDAPDRAQVRATIVQLGGRAPDEPAAAADPPASAGLLASSSGSFGPAPAAALSPSSALSAPTATEAAARGSDPTLSPGAARSREDGASTLTATTPPSPVPHHARRWPIWVGVAAGVTVTALAIGLGVGLSSGSSPSSGSSSSPMLGSAGTFDTRAH